MAQVSYRKIAKSYGAVEVMRDVELDIADGEFAVLLGSSGCGKTTLLRMTAGLETITAGDLMIGGARVNDRPPKDRDIAMVFQNYALYPTMKVFENIAFSLRVKKAPEAEVKRKVGAAAEVLNLTDYLDRYPRELSGGQRQRVAMGRAMVRDAEVFLFDEPLSNLDAKLRAHMRVEIRQLHDRQGATTIYVTHDQIEAMTMADKIVLMKGGKVEQVGTPDELYDRPVSKYAADFVGSPSMNFIEGEIGEREGAPIFLAEGVAAPLPAPMARHLGRRTIAGLRPSDLHPAENGAVQGTLTLAEKTGADQNLHVRAAGVDIVSTAPRNFQVRQGQHIALAIPPERVHLFDAATERRLGA
ncbi:ABC transporter ATP-binding protein [Poseidonocella sp. HB161398]|uniref:ABC transporter ATP-binding protein n=1 Tax=Poseidonocella sp. HB161398 TaxID=2320855 RepID=UPI001107CF34|nr:sn-glycerol-3-phosphate ABC transporter ATP-binding protein UgpC [Poseidonocella sp. HB161398]